MTCPGATKAVDDFLSDKPEKMIVLPCGGGFLIKDVATELTPRTISSD
jgi:O-methyltransferase